MKRRIHLTGKRLSAWYRANARDLPWRRTRDPYAIWISEIMLQQTQVKTVIPYWERWMRELPNIQSLATADEQRVLKLWEGLGYYTRARNLQKAARFICENHGGTFPNVFEQILALPGIGRYTAGAITSIAFNQPKPILDGNVVRVLTRQFAIEGDPKSPSIQQQLWDLSTRLVTSADCPSSLNQGLMELGATICTPRDPLCSSCPLQCNCAAFKTNQVTAFPQIPARKKPRQRKFIAYILRSGEHFLVRKRSKDVVNGNLWEFPNIEILRGQKNQPALPTLKLKPFATIKHTITNNRITLTAKTAEVNGEAAKLAQRFSAEWRTLRDLNALPFSSAHATLRGLL